MRQEKVEGKKLLRTYFEIEVPVEPEMMLLFLSSVDEELQKLIDSDCEANKLLDRYNTPQLQSRLEIIQKKKIGFVKGLSLFFF